MHGLGNDFVVIDAINQVVELTAAKIRQLADRHYGVGFDQLLVVEPASGDADFRYVIYNADGSEVSQCGNGARCFALFITQKGLTDKSIIRVETGAGELVLTLNEQNDVTVDMGEPVFAPKSIPLLVKQEQSQYSVSIIDNEVEFSALSMGNPHAVIQVDDIDTAPVERVGAAMESHDVFPERANIGFSQITGESSMTLRVYERGAGETLACGSGACAAVVAGIQLGKLSSPVTVKLVGGELSIAWQGKGSSVMMTGPATFVFDGMIEL
ncbi:MAG: diaminopimelate epimerase [Cycloclasticus sp. symbiont of Bathymodiolus heckerae]|nr:MAG: diaminopimelate epimerase [Cycloclasticus sp. symbiont of Bathymodiolus heckerae]